jgi:glutathione gamma-glutamylcysteinyltransferase
MALNALLIDPQRVYDGVWRWFNEEMLDCCEPLDKVRVEGICLEKVACLARCNGANVRLHFGTESDLENFRKDIQLACKVPDHDNRNVMVVSYSRESLKQVGIGHFSPIGAYHPQSDRVLVMDVARFKYPPHWLPVEDLFHAMMAIDVDTGKSRGYMMLTRSKEALSLPSCVCNDSSSGSCTTSICTVSERDDSTD